MYFEAICHSHRTTGAHRTIASDAAELLLPNERAPTMPAMLIFLGDPPRCCQVIESSLSHAQKDATGIPSRSTVGGDALLDVEEALPGVRSQGSQALRHVAQGE